MLALRVKTTNNILLVPSIPSSTFFLMTFGALHEKNILFVNSKVVQPSLCPPESLDHFFSNNQISPEIRCVSTVLWYILINKRDILHLSFISVYSGVFIYHPSLQRPVISGFNLHNKIVWYLFKISICLLTFTIMVIVDV